MKNKLFIKIILLATVGILTACTNQNSPSNANSATTTEITSSETTTNTTITAEMTTTATPVTEIKSETELSLIELSKKSFNDYASDDYKFLLNTDRTSYNKKRTFPEKLFRATSLHRSLPDKCCKQM